MLSLLSMGSATRWLWLPGSGGVRVAWQWRPPRLQAAGLQYTGKSNRQLHRCAKAITQWASALIENLEGSAALQPVSRVGLE